MRHDFDVEEISVNALHGASTQEQAKREMEMFFPLETTVAVMKPGLTPEQKSKTLLLDDSFVMILFKH